MEWTTGGDPGAKVKGEPSSQGQFCLQCGAWRGSLGLEPTPELYISHIVQVFREVFRVLRKDGVLFLNISGCYAGGGRAGKNGMAYGGIEQNRANVGAKWGPPTGKITGYKPKDYIDIPAMVSGALRSQVGFYYRQPIVWAKGISFCDTYSGSVMPESCTDRFCNSYEMVYLMTKNSKYWFDLEAVKEKSTGQNGQAANFARDTKDHIIPNQSVSQHRLNRKSTEDSGGRTPRSVWAINPEASTWEYCSACKRFYDGPEKKYIRKLTKTDEKGNETVDRICTCGRSDAWVGHFAAFGQELVSKCLLAGCPPKVCPECGAPWERIVEKDDTKPSYRTWLKTQDDKGKLSGLREDGMGRGILQRYYNEIYDGSVPAKKTIGWKPGCECRFCPDECPKVKDGSWHQCYENYECGLVEYEPTKFGSIPGTCLDPFGGSGTVALTAEKFNRSWILAELNPDYCEISKARIKRATQQMTLY